MFMRSRLMGVCFAPALYNGIKTLVEWILKLFGGSKCKLKTRNLINAEVFTASVSIMIKYFGL